MRGRSRESLLTLELATEAALARAPAHSVSQLALVSDSDLPQWINPWAHLWRELDNH
jgi:hypothetical protein